MLTAEQRKASYEQRSITRRVNRLAKLTAQAQQGAIQLLNGESVTAPTVPQQKRKNPRGGRNLPYPTDLMVKVRSQDAQRAAQNGKKGCAIERAVRRNLFYMNLLPKKVVVIGNMVAVARQTTPRGQEEQWWEYLCTESKRFRNYSYRAKRNLGVSDQTFAFRLLRSYTTP